MNALFVFCLILPAAAYFFDNKTNTTDVTVGWIWSLSPMEDLDGAKASSSLAAILYAMKDISELLNDKVNFSYAQRN